MNFLNSIDRKKLTLASIVVAGLFADAAGRSAEFDEVAPVHALPVVISHLRLP